MRLFRFPKRNPKYTQDETPLMRLFRYIIVVLLFCAVVWGFWLNNQRRMESLKKPPAAAVVDRTGSLDPEQERRLSAFQDRFREAYGIPLSISVTQDPSFTALRASGAGTVLLGIAPGSGAVLFEAPPLARAALGEPLLLYIRHVHFVPYFARNAWPEGLESALNLIVSRLDAATGQSPRSPRHP